MLQGGGRDVLERPYTAGEGGVNPPPPGPPSPPLQCLRLTAKILLRRLQCQEALSLIVFGPPLAGTIGRRAVAATPPPSCYLRGHRQGGVYTRQCRFKVVHTQGGAHKRRSVATA